MSYWSGKTAIVTGGSSGLGRSLAEVLASRGAQIVLAARNADRLGAVAAALGERGADALAIETDVTREDDVVRLVDQTIEAFGNLDLLVNCAGRSDRAQVLETTPDEFRTMMELNLLGPVRCTRAAMPRLIETGGHVINIGSLAGKFATPFHGAYPASKFALAAYSQQLRLALRMQGVHVLLVAPGPIAPRHDDPPRSPTRGDLPATAMRPGAGARLRAIDSQKLAFRILASCERRRAELVVPARARVLAALSACSVRLGDWMLRRYSKS